jgi:hypothetical protein
MTDYSPARPRLPGIPREAKSYDFAAGPRALGAPSGSCIGRLTNQKEECMKKSALRTAEMPPLFLQELTLS